MCGLVGLFRCEGSVETTRLAFAADELAHRGPDHADTFCDGPFGMAHTRLSIIDLSGGHQPLFARGGEVVLIANGEIYNHIELREALERQGQVFATRSDSEVILHAYLAYGLDFLRHLRGMFAFALYDKGRKRLLLARDRLGIKPLFIARTAEGIAFASEIKALLPLFDRTPALNAAGLAEYLQNQFTAGRTTVLQGVERILPAEAICIEQGQIVKRWRYWSALNIKPAEMDYAQAEERFDALMDSVMTEHMRTDVPFGLFLSGGVDSAILLALLSRHAQEPIRTFSVGFAGTRLVDELPLATAIAERFGSRHLEVRPTPEDIFFSLPLTVWAADDLMRDYANLPTALLAEAAGRELKVVFSGEGGDEVFAGYGRYRASSIERRLKALLMPGSGGFRTRGTFRGHWKRSLFGPALRKVSGRARRPFIAAWKSCPRAWSDLQRMQYVDLATALPDNLLVKADRMLMASSLEGRVPFLDHRVVEFGLALPDALKVEGGQGKSFLKRWASRFLPQEHLYARKRGFHVPIGEWLSPQFRQRARAVLPKHPAVQTWFQPAGVEALLEKADGGGVSGRMIWAILQFAVWHRIFIEGKGERPPARIDPLTFITEK